MIIAKINPGISVVNQPDPFTSPTTTTYYWFTAVIQRYIPGASNYNVNAVYGTATMDGTGVLPVSFKRIGAYPVELTAEEISTWGTNDVVLLQILASKLNLTIENTYEITDSFK